MKMDYLKKGWLISFLWLFLLPTVVMAKDTNVLRAGDVLHIAFPGERVFNKDFPVDHNGQILLPEVGAVQVAGKSFDSAKKEIRKVLGKAYLDLSHVKIFLMQRRFMVSVLGAVTTPGKVTLDANGNVQLALQAAGGTKPNAEVTRLQLLRNGKRESFNYQQYLDTGNMTSIPKLQAGDEIFVPTQTEQSMVQILGGVTKPGRYQWTKDMTLLDLIVDAGGPGVDANTSNIKVVGPDKSSQIFNIKSFLEDGGNMANIPRIQAGSTVVVGRMPTAAVGAGNNLDWVKLHPKDAVYVFGQVGNPGRYKYKKSLGFIDVISAANGPSPTADTHRIRVVNRYARRPHVEHVNLALYFQTGDSALLPRIMPGDIIYVPGQDSNWLDNSPQSTIRVLGAVGKPGRYQYADNMTILDLLAEAGGPTNTAYLDHIVVINTSNRQQKAVSFNMERFAKTGNPHLLPVLRAGDTIYVPDTSNSHWSVFMEKVRDLATIAILVAAFSD